MDRRSKLTIVYCAFNITSSEAYLITLQKWPQCRLHRRSPVICGGTWKQFSQISLRQKLSLCNKVTYKSFPHIQRLNVTSSDSCPALRGSNQLLGTFSSPLAVFQRHFVRRITLTVRYNFYCEMALGEDNLNHNTHQRRKPNPAKASQELALMPYLRDALTKRKIIRGSTVG